jgi:hypothetical protein
MESTDWQQNPPSAAQAPKQPTEKGPPPAAAPGPAPSTGAMSMPEALLSQGMCSLNTSNNKADSSIVQDENLKRLMMSWYFAGYYTGLYEGQQQANQGKN